MKSKSKHVRSFCLATAVVAAMAALGGSSKNSPISALSEYAQKVKAGMSRAEVVAVLGKGEVVAFKDLPDFYRKSIAQGGETGEYWRWYNQ